VLEIAGVEHGLIHCKARIFRFTQNDPAHHAGHTAAIDAWGSNTAVLNAVKKLSPGYELITLYYGDGGDLATTEALARRIHDLGTGAEVEVLHGGQPHYRYLISAE